MTTLNVNTIKPAGATLTLGESGDTVVFADDVKVNTIKDAGGGYKYETFTTVETISWTAPTGVTSVEYLVVGGGGGGGNAGSDSAGGGGAGDFAASTLAVTPSSSYTVTVGAGGAGSTSNANDGASGSSSVFSSITATGGGGGGSQSSTPGSDGASGGGGAGPSGTGGSATSATTGYDGGNAVAGSGQENAGGGGGSGSVGLPGNPTLTKGGDGGSGTSSSITGNLILYAGGGGGGAYAAATGGTGQAGGGNGGYTPGANPGTDARTNSGSGGGGGASYTGNAANGGDGGSGIVVLKYQDPTPNTLWISDGSGTVSSVKAGIGGADKLLSTQTISNAASASITSGFDSTYKEYIIKWINLQPVTDGPWFQWQASTDGGSNYNTTCTTAIFTAQHNEDGSGGQLGYNTGQDAAQSTGYIYTSGSFGNANGPRGAECGVITIHLFNPSSTTYVKNWYLEDQHYQGDNWSMNIFTGGYFNTTSAINAVNFKFDSGNINAGTLKLYGIAS